MKDYAYDKLWELLEWGFTIEELKDFCFVTRSFKSFRHREIPNESFKRELLLYAEQKLLIDDLLNWAKQTSPKRYDLHQKYIIEVPEEEVAESYRLTRARSLRFFRLEDDHPEITIYISKHSKVARLPYISVSDDDAAVSPALRRIKEFQVAENSAGEQQMDLQEFTTVSAIELIEASRLVREIDQSNLLSLFSVKQQRLLPSNIRAKLDVCPDEGVHKLHEENRTTVFIGGPRANLGTYYYLFGEQAGQMRLQRNACIVEGIFDPDNRITCGLSKNLGIVQRHHMQGNGRTIIYLAGTGVNGTAAAVAYMRLHWIDLLEEFADNDFCRVIEVERRTKDDIPEYISREWTDDKWVVHR